MAHLETFVQRTQEYVQTVWDDTQVGLGTAYSSLLERLVRMGGAGEGRAWLLGAVAVNSLAARAGLPMIEGMDDQVAASVLLVDDSPVERMSYAQAPPPTDDIIPPDGPVLERGTGDPIPVAPPLETEAADPDPPYEHWFDQLYWGPNEIEVPEVTDTPEPAPAPTAPTIVPEVPDPNPDDSVALPPLTGEVPDPNPDDPSVAPPAERDTPSGNRIFETEPLPGEYLWDVLDRAGVPHDQIMPTINEAVDGLRSAGGHEVEWHGCTEFNQWLEIDGESETDVLWRHLRPYLELT